MQTKFCSMSLNKWIQLNFSFSICWLTLSFLSRIFVVHFLIVRTRLYMLCVYTLTGFSMIRWEELGEIPLVCVIFFGLRIVAWQYHRHRLHNHCHLIESLCLWSFGFNFEHFTHTHTFNRHPFSFALSLKTRFTFKNPCANDCFFFFKRFSTHTHNALQFQYVS